MLKRKYGLVFAAGCAAAGAAAVFLGLDDGYDLRYYHYWVSYAFLNHRLGFDYAPAQVQSYLNPFSFLPFYFLVNHVPSTVTGFLLGAWHGLTFGLVFILANEVFRRFWLALFCAVLGTVAPLFVTGLGTSGNDTPVAHLVLLSVFLMLRWCRRGESGHLDVSKWLLGSAVVLGMAMGLKLVAGIYALAVLVTFLVLPLDRRTRPRVVGAYVAMLVLGFLVTNGYWMIVLWKHFGSPTFPFFNAIFRSPYYTPTNFADKRWIPRELVETLLYPLLLATRSHREAGLGFRDARFAVLFLLGLGVLLRLAWSKRPWRQAAASPVSANDDPPPALAASRSVERFLLVFFPVAYVAWQSQFAIARYAVALEAVAPVLLILLVRRLTPRRLHQFLLVALCSVVILARMHPFDQDRIPWPAKIIDVQAPQFPDPSRILVVVAHNAPWSFVLPSLQPEIRVLGLVSNFTKPEHQTRFQQEMREIIANHTGLIFLLTDEGYLEGDRDVVREHYGLLPLPVQCPRIMTYLQSIPIYLCPVRKSDS